MDAVVIANDQANRLAREHDALANMAGAESRRVDQLVDDVGQIKGKVESVDRGVNELRSAMAVLVRHEVLMEQAGAVAAANTTKLDGMSARLHKVEEHMPGLIEARGDVRRILWIVVAAVCAGVLALVVKVPS
jgi:uncharacterized membrane protein YdfJ with MMPL/SSD domain